MRVFNRPGVGGRTRILILGAAHYPFAQIDKLRVPKLPDMSSAAKSAVDFAARCITDWQDAFARPIASIDLLVNDAAGPDGIVFSVPGGGPLQLEAPTLANIKAARRQWMDGAGPDDLLLFYCCGHGVWLPSVSRTFLASDFGIDEDEPWSNAIALDDFRLALGDHPPRTQWLLFDCCANTPTEALEALRARANSLLQPQAGAIRTARSRTSGANLFVVLLIQAPPSQELEPPTNPGRFKLAPLRLTHAVPVRP